jgi:tetratricopeptide (TPR) repeat protein
MGDLLQLVVYNPAILKDEDFLAGFVARRELVDDILVSLRAITCRSLAKHRLILGQRGMGKTSILRRIVLGISDDPKLSKVLLPLTFREEQYNVHNLYTLWCNCLDALCDYFERTGQCEKARALDQEVAALTHRGGDPQDKDEGEAALAVLKEWSKREGKRPLLMLDNIDLILDGLEKQHWSLRRTLQEAGGIVVIGAASAYLEATTDPNGAFYDFFQVTVLERLGHQELLCCLRRLAEVRGAEGGKVLSILSSDPGRVQTLYDLTGGNPRTLVLLYLLLERDADGDVMQDLESLLDQVTVLYKSRVEDLAPQARVVLDALALAWNPVIAADLSSATGMDTSAVSSQIDRLLKNGVVEKVSVSTTSRAAFQLGERFFNIWYLMRHGPRRKRTRLRWLVGFLRGFYSPLQLTEKATDILKRQGEAAHSHGHYYLALSEAVEDVALRNLLGQEARRELECLAAEQGKCLNEIVDADELPEPKTSTEWNSVGQWLHTKLERYAEAETAYRRAIEIDPKYARPWYNLGKLLTYRLERHEEAEAAYRRAIEIDPKDAMPWYNLGKLLTYRLERHEEADSAYRHAIEIDPKVAMTWYNLGKLLTYRLDRHEEAEAAYRRAIEIDPKDGGPWNDLGNLLVSRLGRYGEAEAAYRCAIELNPKDARPWNDLGNLLDSRLGRYEEAEAAYRCAIKIDPNDARPWNDLGHLFTYRLGRYEEAEAAYRRAIEIDPKDTVPWNCLGYLLSDRLGRYEEAEAAYRRATEIAPDETFGWCNLGYLCLYFLDKPNDAESAYREALRLEPEDLVAASNLLAIYLTQPDRQAEAEETFEAIVPRHPSDGAGLLRSIRALTQNNLSDAIIGLKDALSSKHENVFGDYGGFYMLVLRLVVQHGFGDKLLAWMDEEGFTDRYWPLRTAFDAYIHGEERLMDVNPEVRGAAKHIYDLLGSNRRGREKLPEVVPVGKKPRKKAKK